MINFASIWNTYKIIRIIINETAQTFHSLSGFLSGDLRHPLFYVMQYFYFFCLEVALALTTVFI